MGKPGRLRDCNGASSLDNDLDSAPGLERADGEDIIETLARGPLGDDVAVLRAVVRIEDLDQPTVIQLRCRARGRHHLAEAAESGLEGAHGDGTGKGLIGRLPH